MRLSILDQSPISAHKTAQEALQASMELARFADGAGYTRYWIAEHHDMKGLACPAPDVMLGLIGAQTNRIRIGAGAVLLPHYKPYNIAERYNLLATLFSNRIDLGIGRAPGGSAEATMALSDNFLKQVQAMPESIDQLLHFLHQDFPKTHMFSKIAPSPAPTISPQVWLLGTSKKSGKLAAEKGLPYAFGHFMSDADGPDIIRDYIKQVKYNSSLSKSKPIVAVSVICAETTEEAEELAMSGQLWSVLNNKGEGSEGVPTVQAAKEYNYSAVDLEHVQKHRKNTIIGNPKQVKEQLEHLQDTYNVDEFMIVTITHDYKARKRSYQLLANEILANA